MVSIDNIKFKSYFGLYILWFAKKKFLPCFCYHEKLGIVVNCRICIIAFNGVLGVSCALPLADSMQIFTDSLRVRFIREGLFAMVRHEVGEFALTKIMGSVITLSKAKINKYNFLRKDEKEQ